MRSVIEIAASVPAFLGKLWKLVNDTETNHLISWSPGGKTFVIKNQADFARELLPLYYKHNNMASFIRQLNMYGFHKITSVENGGLRYDKDDIEFSHPCFMRGHAYLLEHIKRKIANPKSIVASNESGEKILLKPELMNKVLADVKQMKGKQESLDAKFSAMKQENEALWREVAILRQKHIKQQQIVNNLIQFLMSLVQPARASNASSNNVGVKRPYQLMINNAAHNSGDSYPGKIKNMKFDKDALEELTEDNMEDGPTIHELAHDDLLHNENSQESMDPAQFVTINIDANSPNLQNSSDPSSLQYHVTLEDGEDIDTDGTRLTFTLAPSNGLLRTSDSQPVVTSPSPTMVSPTSPLARQTTMEKTVTASPGTSKPKTKPYVKKTTTNASSFQNVNNYNTIKPADFGLPAEIFASDDSVSDAGTTTEDINLLQENLLGGEQITSTSKDQMLGGINIKLENPAEAVKPVKKSKKSKDNKNVCNVNLADIKTELQDDFDWNNMTLATVNNNQNVNRLQTMYRRDTMNQKRDDFASLYGLNSNNKTNDIDDHLDTMQTDLDSLRELLRSDSYSLDTNTLLGQSKNEDWMQTREFFKLFGSDDPFYGLSYNPTEERTKTPNNARKKGGISDVSGDDTRDQNTFVEDDAEGNQLISYSGNIPDFEDINMTQLEEDSQECLSPLPSGSTLNTPQVHVASPSYHPLRP
ncbi:heat shock factor protein isoform X1 [Aricia agestis]|uniref:heat shock factor protein isoform X1 n=1 Tax=Aricia agestis TaxID=91739 RepID=UPI001C20C3D2|nr:heat shock factor protein isoform X1 [Aricia agestis]